MLNFFNETGINIQGKRNWLHCLSSDKLTLLYPHQKRGHEAMDEMGIIGKIYTFDVLPHNSKMYWNCIEDEFGPKSRGDLLITWKDLMEKYIVFVQGNVKNLTEWGAFIDLNGVDALLHITDISWRRINKPADLLSIGQSIKAKIIKIEEGTKKISLGVKQLTEDPYKKAINNYEIGKNYPAIVTNVQDYGCFAKLEEGMEGLIHQSELSWTKKNIHPGKILSVSQKIFCEVLEIDKDKKRLSLSYRNCIENPWVVFTKENKVGDVLMGTVKSVVDYGLFISINDKKGVSTSLDGLCHYKDVNYSEKESELERFKKGQTVKVKLLEVNTKDDKIRLGIKQLEDDSFNFFRHLQVGDIVTSVVHSSSQNGVYVNVGKKNFSVLIKKNQLAKELENQRPSRFVKGDKLDALITELDKEKRKVSLSIKALEEIQTKEAVKKYGSKDSGGVLGEILGPLLGKKNKK